MENYNLTPADVAMMTKHHDRSAMAATGIGLSAGLGGGALLLALGLGWGINQASKARARAAEQANQANANTTNLLTQFLIAERQCQHNWQLANTPTISQMVDVRGVAQQGQQSTSSAAAAADVLRKVLICHQCFSFWLTLSLLTIAGCCLPCALLLAIFIAYASNWFSLMLIFLTNKYDDLWRRVNRKNRPRK